MAPRPPLLRSVLTGATAALAWFALALQLALMPFTPLDVLRFFSYFTILSNLLVAVVASWLLLGSTPPSPRLRAAAALYIAVTGGVYVVVLAPLWSPTGLQLVADVLLHNVVPVAYLAAWVAFAPHGALRASDALRFLLFPLVYLGYTVARGALLDEYPYPFVDVATIGYRGAALNAAALALLFLLLGLALVGVDRLLARGRRA